MANPPWGPEDFRWLPAHELGGSGLLDDIRRANQNAGNPLYWVDWDLVVNWKVGVYRFQEDLIGPNPIGALALASAEAWEAPTPRNMTALSLIFDPAGRCTGVRMADEVEVALDPKHLRVINELVDQAVAELRTPAPTRDVLPSPAAQRTGTTAQPVAGPPDHISRLSRILGRLRPGGPPR